VALTAPGEARVYGGVLAADDSSQAAALAAAAAATVLRSAPETTIEDLRAILGLTADVPAEIDGGQGLGASVCEGRDRQGHSFKVGYGRVNGAAAALAASDPIAAALFATRRCPDPPAGLKSFAHQIAEAWDVTWRQWVERRPDAGSDGRPDAGSDGGAVVMREGGASPAAGLSLAADYQRVRGCLARAVLRSPAAGEALAWLARHARAVGEDGGDAWFSASQDHGALFDRLQHAVDVLARSLGDPADADGGAARQAAAWLERFAAALALSDPGDVGVIFGGVLRRATGARYTDQS
jgi:hypothetical protein